MQTIRAQKNARRNQNPAAGNRSSSCQDFGVQQRAAPCAVSFHLFYRRAVEVTDDADIQLSALVEGKCFVQ